MIDGIAMNGKESNNTFPVAEAYTAAVTQQPYGYRKYGALSA